MERKNITVNGHEYTIKIDTEKKEMIIEGMTQTELLMKDSDLAFTYALMDAMPSGFALGFLLLPDELLNEDNLKSTSAGYHLRENAAGFKKERAIA